MNQLFSALLSRLEASRPRSQRKRQRPSSRPRFTRPRLEALEERNLLSAYGPEQIVHAYGVDRVGFENWNHSMVHGNGAGQTIAIVDAYDDPNVASDLAYFDNNFGIAAPPSFTKVNQYGGSALPAPNAGWAHEIALDVEYVHAMAPGANILLVEANSSYLNDLDTAVQTAGNLGASVVSMSYSGGEFSGEPSYDNVYNHAGTTYLAATGDSGAPSGIPAYFPDVVAVGGTSLNADNGGNYISETGWSGSGGGYSAYQGEPFYQYTVQNSGRRTVPDIAMDADPNTGVWVYNSYSGGGWGVWGGTSLATPLMAGVTAIVDQGDAYLFGQGSYSGTNYLNALYNLPQTDLNDITSGYNGYYAGPGYDLVTGRGTPIVDRFVSAMDGEPVYNPLTGELLVTGGAYNSNDTITLGTSGAYTTVNIASSNPVPGSGIPANQTFYYTSGQFNSITIDTGTGNTTVNIQNTTGVTVNLEDHGNTTVNVGTAHNTINVWETSGGGTTINGSSTETINVGKNGSVQNIKGYVILNDPPSFNTVNIDDSADSGNHNASVSLISLGGSTYEYVSGLAPGGIYAKYGDTASMNVQTGTGAEAVVVYSTRFQTTLTGHSGNTSVYVGTGSVQDIQGTLTIINVSSYTAVSVNDLSDTGNRNVTIGASGITGLSPASINFGSASVKSVAIYGGSGNNTYTINGSQAYNGTTLYTGDGVDTVNVLATPYALSVGLGAGDGSDVINFGNAGSVQGITGAVTLYLAGIFSTRAHVNIDDSADTGNRNVSISSGGISGLAPGALNFTASSVSTLSIYGGHGTNTYTVTGTPALNSVSLYAGSGGNNNTLIGPNATNTWQITGPNDGQLLSSSSAHITFFAVANLIGGSGNDDFVFANGAGVAGNIDGGGGTNMLDYSAYTTGVIVDLTAPTATGVGGTVANIQQLRGGQGNDSLTGNSGGTTTYYASPGNDTITEAGSTDTLIGTNAASTWNVTAQNTGTLTFGTSTTTFSGVQNLTGGTGNDTFVFADGTGVDGNIDGGGGSNTLNESAYTSPVAIDLSANTATGVGGTFANLQNFIGSSAGGNSLNGPNANTTWNLSGTDSGTLTGGFSFTAFGTLNGGSASNVFILAAGAVVDGSINGGTGSNTLVGPNAANTWSLSAQNTGTLSGGATANFAGIQNLSGGSAADDFILADGTGVDGSINGGGGSNTLDESAYTSSVTVNLAASTATGVGSTFSNLQNFIGSSGGGSSLNGPNANTTWNITAQNAGTLSGGINFSAFQNLTGGLGVDAFLFANGVGVDGNLDGGGGTNTLNESAYSTPVTVDLSATTATGVGGNIANLQNFIGSAAGGNSLNGPDANTTWNLSGSNAGTLSGGFSFTAFQNLTGGAGDNTFVFAPGATVAGIITGGGGTNTLDYSAYTGDVLVDLQTGQATAVAGGVANIVNVNGANSSGAGLYNLLIGAGGNVLTGGSGRRNILVAGASASTLIGGGQDDLLIGGSTSYDTEAGLTSWQQIAAYWAGSDPYSTRVNNLETGNGVPLLDATIVSGNGGGNTLSGIGELALIYSDGADTISGFNASSQTVTISP